MSTICSVLKKLIGLVWANETRFSAEPDHVQCASPPSILKVSDHLPSS